MEAITCSEMRHLGRLRFKRSGGVNVFVPNITLQPSSQNKNNLMSDYSEENENNLQTTSPQEIRSARLFPDYFLLRKIDEPQNDQK